LKYKVFLPIAKANDFKDPVTGKWMIPDIQWEKSLNFEQEMEERKLYIDLWSKGIISTKTLYAKLPGDLNFLNEVRALEEEIKTIFDKGDKRLPKEFSPVPLEEPSMLGPEVPSFTEETAPEGMEMPAPEEMSEEIEIPMSEEIPIEEMPPTEEV
jgi:hypothetical protein